MVCAYVCARNTDAAMIILCSFICHYSGHGVFATQYFCKGDFLLDYRGEIIRPEDVTCCLVKLTCTIF